MTENATFTDGPLILLFADDHNNLKLQEQLKQVRNANQQLPQPVKSLVVLSDSVEDLDGNAFTDFTAARIRNDYDVWPDEFLFILVGADGTVQRKEAFVMRDEDITKVIHHPG